jgi:CDP-glucose 4,6-dehydratase
MNSAFWNGKRVFVTGHTGFKGGWLTLWLNQMGARVCGYALQPPSEPNLFAAARVSDICDSRIGDIRDGYALRAAMQSFKPEIVLHLAAQPLVRLSYKEPVETYSTNVMGLVGVYEAVRATDSVRSIVNVTSDKCYENREWVWGYREIDPMGGYDPYSSSKGCAELITAAYRRSYFAQNGVGLASARAGNVIGGGDWAADRLVPDFIRSVTRGEKLIIRSPNATRPWQHVLEPLSGYLALAERLHADLAFGDGWNFGPDEDSVKPVQWIADTICREWGDGASWGLTADADLHEAGNLSLVSAKAHQQLKWRPRWSLGTALQKVVEWHKAFNNQADMQQVCLRQIAAFTAANTNGA